MYGFHTPIHNRTGNNNRDHLILQPHHALGCNQNAVHKLTSELPEGFVKQAASCASHHRYWDFTKVLQVNLGQLIYRQHLKLLKESLTHFTDEQRG
jgi:hypothetical protein